MSISGHVNEQRFVILHLQTSFAFLCKSAWYGSVLVTEMHIIETHPLKNVDSENANK